MSYNNLGTLLWDLNEHEQAREYLEKSLAIRLSIYGEEHSDVARSYNNLGAVFLKLGEHEQARECFEKRDSIEQGIEEKRGSAGEEE